MAGETVFPAFIRATFQDGPDGFPAFEASAVKATGRIGQQIKAGLKQAGQDGGRALGEAILGATGSLNLDLPGLRRAAAAATEQATELRRVAQAADAAAAELGQTNALAIQYATAARAAAAAAEAHALALGQDATAAEQLQAAMLRASGGVNVLSRVQRQVANDNNANRQATAQLGQQVQDFAIQVQGGQNVLVAFTQQMSQAAFVMQGMSGTAGAVARFFVGPWGTAFIIATAILTPFVSKLFEAKEAADLAKTGADGLATAQSALSGIFDMTSGAIEKQNQLLIANARLTAVNLRAEAVARRAAFGTAALNAGEVNNLTGAPRLALAAIGANNFDGLTKNARNLLADVERGAIKSGDAIKIAETLDLKQSGISRKELLQAIIDIETARSSESAADAIDKSLDSGRLDPRIPRKKGPKPKDRTTELQRLEEFGEDAGKRFANVLDQFGDTPPQITKVNKALRDVDDILDDIRRKKPPNLEQLLKDGERAKDVIRDALNRPFDDFVEQQQEALSIQKLLSEGREAEAEAQRIIFDLERQMGPLRDEQKQAVLDTVVGLERQRRATEALRQTQQAYLSSLGNARSTIEDSVRLLAQGRLGAAGGNLLSGFRNLFQDLFARTLTEKLFGDVFRQLEDEVTGANKVDKAADIIVSSFGDTAKAAADLARSLRRAANDNPAGAAGALASGVRVDEDGTIEVSGRRISRSQTGARAALDPFTFIGNASDRFAKVLGDELDQVFGTRFFGKFSGVLGSTLSGYAIGGKPGAVVSGVLSAFGAGGPFDLTKVTGALGQAASAISSAAPVISAGIAINQTIAKALGNDQIKNGMLLSLVVGPFFAKAIGSSLRGSATLGFENGSLGTVSTRGNSSKRREAAAATVDALGSTLESIADQFGASFGSDPSVSIGIRKKTYVVDTTGRGRTKGAGVIRVGKGEEGAQEALRIAALDALKDGVIVGLRQGSQQLLRNAKDLEAGLSKALKFESVFIRLKQIEDPVGAAIDAVDKEFSGLRRIFEQAGASAEELASLEKLYGIERTNAVKEAGEAMTSTLKNLLDDLRTGDNGLSLRDRLSAALETYNPLREQLRAGTLKDFDAYAQAARTVLDIERQLGGSQDSYFARFNEVTSDSKLALDRQQAVIDAAAGRPPALGGTPAVNDNAPVVSAIDSQTQALIAALGGRLDAVNQNLGLLLAGSSGGGGGRGFEFSYANNF